MWGRVLNNQSFFTARARSHSDVSRNSLSFLCSVKIALYTQEIDSNYCPAIINHRSRKPTTTIINVNRLHNFLEREYLTQKKAITYVIMIIALAANSALSHNKSLLLLLLLLSFIRRSSKDILCKSRAQNYKSPRMHALSVRPIK